MQPERPIEPSTTDTPRQPFFSVPCDFPQCGKLVHCVIFSVMCIPHFQIKNIIIIFNAKNTDFCYHTLFAITLPIL